MAQLLELEELPIRLTARGEWLHGTTPLHPRVAALFARHVVPQADGQYRIQLGHARHVLEVEDTAFTVRRIDPQMRQEMLHSVVLHMSDGAQEALDPRTLMQSASHILYCRVQRHALAVPARFTAQQYHSLGLYMEQVGDHFYLNIEGHLWPLGVYVPDSIAIADICPASASYHDLGATGSVCVR